MEQKKERRDAQERRTNNEGRVPVEGIVQVEGIAPKEKGTLLRVKAQRYLSFWAFGGPERGAKGLAPGDFLYFWGEVLPRRGGGGIIIARHLYPLDGVGKEDVFLRTSAVGKVLSYDFRYLSNGTPLLHGTLSFGGLPIRFALFSDKGASLADKLRKGSLLYIEGSIQEDRWGEEGNRKYGLSLRLERAVLVRESDSSWAEGAEKRGGERRAAGVVEEEDRDFDLSDLPDLPDLPELETY
jgi:hypothetical protein